MRRAAAIATLAALTGCSEPPPGPTDPPRSEGDAIAGGEVEPPAVVRVQESPRASLVPAMDRARCFDPPDGMVCISGEPTYYMDRHDITNAEYDACHAAGACRPRVDRERDADRPARGLDWFRARGYCAWAGKRLPTDEEWERAGQPQVGTRCATSQPFLTRFPPMHLTTRRDAPPDPEPPTQHELAIVAAVPNDPIEDKPICSEQVRAEWGALQADGGRSETTCRDPFSYLRSNEPRGDHWIGYIEHLGGGYVGVGSDQNYSLIAIARSQWAWIVDHDPRVYANHLRLRAFVMAAATPRELVELFAARNERQALRILEAAYPGNDALRKGYLATREHLQPYYAEQTRPNRTAPDFGWLRNAEHYAYVRLLFEQGRLRPVAGDLLGPSAMTGIGAACQEIGVPVRVYYTSNAPSSWGGTLTDAYRRNVLALPFDEWSVVLQIKSSGAFHQSGKWHHNVTWGRTMHERLALPEYTAIWKLLEGAIPGHHGDVTILGLPSGVPR